ncbi:MAG: YhfC family glutamic-type intramembrane protease [Erysipelotrichaceae bacterium]|nr:YhfC family glutamic-type intramembrane protease [Erysipelotrichaceae bacterium]
MIDQFTMFSLYFANLMTVVLPVFIIVYGLMKKHFEVTRLLLGMFIFLVINLFVLSPLLNLLAVVLEGNALLAQPSFTIPFSILIITLVNVYGKNFSFRYLLQDFRSFKQVISIAIGMGTSEVLLSSGMMMFSNLNYAIKINNGTIYDILSVTDAEAIINNAMSALPDAILYYALSAIAIILINVVLSFILVNARLIKEKRLLIIGLSMLIIFNVIIYLLPMYGQFMLSGIFSLIFALLAMYFAKLKGFFIFDLK